MGSWPLTRFQCLECGLKSLALLASDPDIAPFPSSPIACRNCLASRMIWKVHFQRSGITLHPTFLDQVAEYVHGDLQKVASRRYLLKLVLTRRGSVFRQLEHCFMSDTKDALDHILEYCG